jgi:uncharacterized membrane protein YdbT with pleckstrin-like domain
MSRDLDDLLASDEKIVLETRQHWWVLVLRLAVPVLGLILLGVAIWYDGDAGWLDNRGGDYLGVALWIGWALVAVLALWRVLGWATERFYVTTSKVVYVRGVLDRDVTSTPLVKIDELILRRPLLGRMLGYGRLDVENAAGGAEPLAGLEYLPRPIRLYQEISERSRSQRMIEGGAHRDADGDGLADSTERPANSAVRPDASQE